jgi:hypothetical protein
MASIFIEFFNNSAFLVSIKLDFPISTSPFADPLQLNVLNGWERLCDELYGGRRLSFRNWGSVESEGKIYYWNGREASGYAFLIRQFRM